MARKKKNQDPIPADAAFIGVQMSLWQDFLCNTAEERDHLSNTVELWDSLPKYAVSQQAMNKACTPEGYLPRLEKSFVYRDRSYKVRISPAIIDSEEGGDKAFYPSANEELIEDALRKIAAGQYKGFFDTQAFKSSVVFSIHILRQELKKRGHTRSYQEIIRSLHVLAGSHIEILLPDGKGFAQTSYLPALAEISRAMLAEDPKARWAAQFHPLVTEGIDTLSYRQYNYHLMMSHSTQLARWLHKRLSHNYVNASFTVPYRLRLSAIRRNGVFRRIVSQTPSLPISLWSSASCLRAHPCACAASTTGKTPVDGFWIGRAKFMRCWSATTPAPRSRLRFCTSGLLLETVLLSAVLWKGLAMVAIPQDAGPRHSVEIG